MKLTNHYSMSYNQRVLLLFFTLIIINKIAPPPPIRDFNNNTYDCNEESGRSALIWQQIINKSAPPPEIRDHPLFAVVVSLICGGSLWAVVVVKFHRVINNTTWYYDQSYTIMTLCKHRLASTGKSGVRQEEPPFHHFSCTTIQVVWK